MDRFVHTLFIVVCYISKSDIDKSGWKGISIETMAAITFKLISPFLWSTFQIALEWDGESKLPG